MLCPGCDPQELLSPKAHHRRVPQGLLPQPCRNAGLGAKVSFLVSFVRAFNSMGDLLEEAVVSLDIGGWVWADVWGQISTKLFAVHLRRLAVCRAAATQGSGGVPVGSELPSHHCKGYPRAGEGYGLSWLLPAAIWCLYDHVQLPQIMAVPQPQAAGGCTGPGQGIKGVHPTDTLTVLLHGRSAEASVFSLRCAHLDTKEVSTVQRYFWGSKNVGQLSGHSPPPPPPPISSNFTSLPVSGNRYFPLPQKAVLEVSWFANGNFYKTDSSHEFSLSGFGPCGFCWVWVFSPCE